MKILEQKKYAWVIASVFMPTLLFCGCFPQVGIGQSLGAQPFLLLNQTYSLEQTFTASQNGLMGAPICCVYHEPGSGKRYAPIILMAS